MIDNNSPVLPVGIVCGYIKRIFESEELLHNITILGEVTNLKTTGGYAYFNLKDNDGLLPCVCFGLYKTQIPKDGDKVFVSGSISFYAKGGKVSFVVDKISYTGKGELLLYYQELKDRLQKEGLFDESHKKNIPSYPSSVCVVTSKNGAAIKDVVKTIRNKNTFIDIYVVDVKVQGESAPKEIVDGIKLADKMNADLIILARGGGSYEDLLSFCDERVVRAVYDCKTPLISAVGHETDVTLVDFVSDLRVATPTAAGECATWDYNEVREYTLNQLKKIYKNAEKKYFDGQNRLNNLLNNLSLLSGYFYEKNKRRFLNATNRAVLGLNQKINERYMQTNLLLKRIDSANPISILRKGLYKVHFKDKPLVNVQEIDVGDCIILESLDAKIGAKVEYIVNKKGEE